MTTPKTGEVVWFDIPVTDFERAKAFYGEWLGWKFVPMGEAKTTNYWMIQVGKETIGGLRHAETTIKETETPVIYFAVDRLDPAVTRAKKLGATVVGDRVDIGDDSGCYQWFRDKDKNLVGIWAKS